MKNKIEVGKQVAFNNLPDAVWFDVIAVDGFNMRIREIGCPDHAEQHADTSMVKQVRAAR